MRHRLVPLLEEGGRFGDHALALLSEIAGFAGAQTGKLKVLESWACSSPKLLKLPLLTGCARSGAQVEAGGLSTLSLDRFRSPCLTLSFATLLRQTSRASVHGSYNYGKDPRSLR